MRTTVTLDPDTEQLVRRRMAEQQVSFKQALNDAIREGAERAGPARPFATQARSLGTASVSLDHALRLAAELEDDELARRADRGA
jgi:hypothetical protein